MGDPVVPDVNDTTATPASNLVPSTSRWMRSSSVAVARGPLVYCVEQQDSAVAVDDLVLEPAEVSRARVVPAAVVDGVQESVVLEVTAVAAAPRSRELYPVLTGSSINWGTASPVTLVPYFLWGNREVGAMRVWLRQF